MKQPTVKAVTQMILDSQREPQLLAEIDRLKDVLELYACPGLGTGCPERRLKDGTCVRAASGGLCGDDARKALEENDHQKRNRTLDATIDKLYDEVGNPKG